MSLIGKHWRGSLPLWISFWLIGLLPIVLIRLAEPRWLPLVPLETQWAVPAVLAYAVFVALLLFPWQAVGVIRSAYQHFEQVGKSHILYTVQAAVIAGGIAAASHFLYTAQRLTALVDQYEFEVSKVDKRLSVERDRKAPGTLLLSGSLVFGSTNDVRAVLAASDDIKRVVLHSDGGQVYEGRGLARLFKEYGLNTHISKQCSSACTTAFVGGVVRSVSAGAQLGFHQYGLDASRSRQVSKNFNTELEQRKDAAIFIEQGVSESFTLEMFETESQDMWFPSIEQLLEAGVVHSVSELD